MRRREWRIIVAVAVIFVAALALLPFLVHENEPTSQGQPLSYWVLREDRQHERSGEKTAADAAIRAIGTNALPLLFKWAQHTQPRWRREAWRLSLKLPTWWLADRIKESRTDILARNSDTALRVLGPEAAPITAQLILLLTNQVASDPWLRAAIVLPGIGTNALPAITAALKDPTKTQGRGVLLAAIRDIRPPPELAAPLVPLVIQMMDEKPYPQMAALTLGALGAEPKTSVPALLGCLERPSPLLRYYAALSLTNFPSKTAVVLPAMTNLLRDPSPLVRRAATNFIRQTRPETLANAPAQ